MEPFARHCLAATGLLLAGGVTAVGHAQTQAPTRGAAQPSRAHQLMGDIAPRMAQLTDGVLFGDIWERPQLAKRGRSLVTVSALIALNPPEQLCSHIALAHQNGVTETEVVKTITHLAFYAGWPNAVTAMSVARDVFRSN